MQPADVTALTAAFNPSALLTSFLGLAPFIITALGLMIGISVVFGVIKAVKSKLSKKAV